MSQKYNDWLPQSRIVRQNKQVDRSAGEGKKKKKWNST